MTLSPGSKLGPYEILAPIGAGGMGEVYKARDTRLDRFVAIKVLPEHIARREDLRARFEREARAVASLNHPNICVLHDIGNQDGVGGYMVMEYLEGETLEARIERGALPLDGALRYGTQIADALDRAHRAGVTHRDIKPGNIILTRDGVKVLDFGLAKSTAKPGPTDATIVNSLTTEGTVLGTPQYMAPEQFEGKEADARSDIWAFGAVLYEMVTGQKAFQGRNYSSLVGAILSADPAPMSVKPFTPAWLERLVRRCLAKDAEERYFAMHDIVLDLRTPPPEIAAAGSAKATRWPWAVAAAAILLAIGSAWITWMAPKATSEPPVRLSIVPPENGTVTAFTVSPDGTKIAFPVAKDGKSRIWVRHLDSDNAFPVPGTEGAGATEAPAWSPDSAQLAFVAGEMLKLVTIQSGKVKDLTRARNRGIAWNRDDVILYVDFQQTIERISASGGMPEKVKMDLGGAVGGRFPHFLPDQNRFLYVTRGVAAGGDQEESIRVGSLDGSTNKSLLAQQRSNAEFVADTGGSFGWLLYLRGGSVFAHRLNLKSLELEGKPVELSDSVGSAIGGTGRSLFSSHSRLLAYRIAESYSVRLVWYDASGNRLREVGEPQRRFGQIQISPDGRQALADLLVGPGQAHIESIDLLSGASTRRSFEVSSNDAVWSPDGTTIYFLGQGNNKSEIYQTTADWSSPPALVHRSDVEIHPSDYHPVHQTLLLYTGLDRAVTLKRNASGWEPGKFPNPDEPFAKGRFSPDGRWVAYQSSTAAGGVFAMAYPPTGAKWQISPDGEEPVWRRDGKELYFIRGQEIMAVSVDGSDRAPRFGTPRSLFRVTLPPRSIPSHRFDVAPDGKFLVMERVAEPPGVPISILLHWQSLLGKQ